MNSVRLNKYLSEQGVVSRREADRLLLEGKVFVNVRRVTTLGTKIDPVADEVAVNGKPVKKTKQFIYLALNKPIGFVVSAKRTSADPDIVFDLISLKEKLFAVGRLDKDTTGLLILTNDGELAHRLTHPSFESDKEYEVTVDGFLTPTVLESLRRGIKIRGRTTNPATVEKTGSNSMRIILAEGRNRQIRRLCQRVGLNVIRLRRVRVKNITLGSLSLGKWRHLTPAEVDGLKTQS